MDMEAYKLEHLVALAGIALRCYERDPAAEVFRFGVPALSDPLAQDRKLQNQLMKLAGKADYPLIQYEIHEIAFGLLQAGGRTYLLGPVDTGNGTPPFELKVYAISHGIEDADNYTIPRQSSEALGHMLCLVHAVLTGSAPAEVLTGQALTPTEPAAKYRLNIIQNMQDRTEQDVERFTYAEERELLQTVANGDIEALNKMNFMRLMRHMGLFSHDVYKQREYTACIIIALAARAIIQGGVSAETALPLQDVALQRLASAGSVAEMEVLCTQVLIGMAHMLNRSREQRVENRFVSKAKSYISTHLSTPFTLEQVARDVGVSPNYLCRRFKEVEGVGMKQYTQKLRLSSAANMLQFTGTPITTIASYFCYADQSYFSKLFRETYGVTPQQYRNGK